MKQKTVWIENLVLFNDCVQKSGGIMEIISSYTNDDGDVSVRACFTKLDIEKETEYNLKRIYKK